MFWHFDCLHPKSLEPTLVGVRISVFLGCWVSLGSLYLHFSVPVALCNLCILALIQFYQLYYCFVHFHRYLHHFVLSQARNLSSGGCRSRQPNPTNHIYLCHWGWRRTSRAPHHHRRSAIVFLSIAALRTLWQLGTNKTGISPSGEASSSLQRQRSC